MATICIVGAGELGGSTAHALARGERVRRVLLIDGDGTIAAGKALDIQQAGAVEGFHTRVDGTNDLTRVAGAAVVVVADSGRAPGSQEWSGETGLSMIARLSGFAGTAPIVFAGASHSDLILAVEREAGVERGRLVGSAPEALAGALRAIVALEAGCSPSEVTLAVLGTPPSGFLVPWGEAAIGGYSLERVLTQVQLRRIEIRLARLWPPGPQALGLAAAKIAEALVTSSRRTMSILTVLGGEFGIRDRTGVLPCLLTPSGIAHIRLPDLHSRERVQLETALES
ncbi:MAG: lactate/malate family dehydrogenase [Vicinamibacterales bacterium]